MKTIGGIFSGSTKAFSEKHLKVKTGDSIILYSDGIIDQQNVLRKRFGTARFLDSLTLDNSISIDHVKQNLEKKYTAYMGGEEQRDDITIIGIRKTSEVKTVIIYTNYRSYKLVKQGALNLYVRWLLACSRYSLL